MGTLLNYDRFRTGSLLRTATLLVLLSLLPAFGYAQTVAVKGIVYDEAGMPAMGVNILKKGTSEGTITDLDGNFEIAAAKGDVLVFSYIGYKSQEVTYQGQIKLEVKLQEDTETLDEVVVIGYGTMKKSDVTGAISSVNVEELASRATTNPAEALQGKVSGVNILKTGGNAGSTVSVRIRGVKSFGDNDPLYIIDGFPGDISNVNPQDIASLEVLKDGAAAAIYGSVAANGVVMVTTKNGKKGDVKVDLNAYVSATRVANQLELLDADGYVQVHKQMYDNYNLQYPSDEPVKYPGYITNPGTYNTNWQDEMFRNGLAQNYMLSVRGGSDNARYSVSYNHADEKGILLGNDFRQDNARLKLSVTKYIFDVDANMSFKATDSKQPQYSLKEMYMISPLVPVYDETKESGFGLTDTNGLPSNRNVMADHVFQDATNKNYYTDANVAVTAHFTDYLNFKSAYSYRGVHARQTTHTPAYVSDVKAKRDYPYHWEGSSYWQEQVIDQILTFDKAFGDHSLNVMAGNSITMRDYTWNSVAVEGKTTVYEVRDGQLVTTEKPGGFLDSSFSTIGAGTGGTYTGDGSKYKYRRVSFFGRVNYAYAGKYMAQVTVRRDGSSKFGSDSRWGFFPSVALGWRISEEEFFPEGAVSNLKLRASWGRLGNEQALGYYDFQALISTYNELYGGYVQGSGSTPWPGSTAMGLANRNLQWETTDTKNIGLDYGFFDNRLSGSFNYYYNQTEDMLITKKLAPSVGLLSPVMNVGKIRNTGVELEINWADKRGDFDYNIGFNLSTTNNKVTELSDPNQSLYGEGLKWGTEHFPTQTRVGKPIAGFWLYRTDGIFRNDEEVAAHVNADGNRLQPDAQPGDIRFRDVNGDGVINEDDKEYCGSGIPKVEANLSFGASFKGIDLSFLLGSGWGAKLYNANRYFYEGMSSGSNFLATTLDAWTPENRDTDVPRAILQDPNGNSRESDRFLENGNFVRLRQLQIGYTLPSAWMKKLYIEKLRVYASAENLFTITDYSGVDPEFSRKDSDDQKKEVLNAGVDKFVYPFTRSFIFGLQLSF